MSDVTAVMDLGVEEPQLSLPPGFRFHPTDEEVVTYYLTPKARNPAFSCPAVADVDLNKKEPWELPGLAKMGEKEWFFFVRKDRKYPTGTRTNRATKVGYWKATGKDKEIFRGKDENAVLVGMKKTLVFYRGRAPRGEKMPWVMHEYRLEGALPHRVHRSAKNDWAVCRVFDKDLAAKNPPPQMAPAADVGMEEDPYAFLDELINNVELPPVLMDSPSGADDFAGASSSASSAALPFDPDMIDLIIKTELPVPQQQMQIPNYFIMPETADGNHGGSGASSYQYQAMGDQQAAIRRYCKPMADAASTSALLGPSLGFNAGALAGAADTPFPMPPSRLSYLDLEELCPGEPLMDFANNMWNV